MREELVRHFAAKLGITDFRPKTHKGWLETRCILAPYTHEKGYDKSPSFAILCDDGGKSYFTCQACKRKGTFANLAFMLYGFSKNKKYRKIGEKIEQAEMREVVNHLPDWDHAQLDQEKEINRRILDPAVEFKRFPFAFYDIDALRYMKSRNISPATSLRMNLRVHPQEDRLIFPVVDRNHELRGFVGRAMYPDADMKVKEYAGLNKIELLLGEDYVFKNRTKFRFVVIVEGPIDRARVLQAGFPNCLALLGSELTKPKMDKLVDLDLPIIWFVDNDKAGAECIYGRPASEDENIRARTGALDLLDAYLPQFLVNYPKKKNDPGQLSDKQIKTMIDNAELWIKER